MHITINLHEKDPIPDALLRNLRQTAHLSGPTLLLLSGSSPRQQQQFASRVSTQLHKSLYRIDLSQVVSQYIGETEKNLSRLLDQVSHLGEVLLFDEADALFGKRTDVQDAHDRYANQEVSHLLDRLHRHRGLIILPCRPPDCNHLMKLGTRKITIRLRRGGRSE